MVLLLSRGAAATKTMTGSLLSHDMSGIALLEAHLAERRQYLGESVRFRRRCGLSWLVSSGAPRASFGDERLAKHLPGGVCVVSAAEYTKVFDRRRTTQRKRMAVLEREKRRSWQRRPSASSNAH